MDDITIAINHWRVAGHGWVRSQWCGFSMNNVLLVCLWFFPFFPIMFLGPAPTGTGTITLDPTFGHFTLLEPVSH
jgi:hypothetical protein